MEVSLCERFPALSPFDVREKRLCDVFLLIRRLNNHDRKKKKHTKIRRPAGDDWF